MVYKHLMEKIEGSHSYVNRLTLVALEACTPRSDNAKNSEMLEDFLDSNFKKTLGWKEDRDTEDLIENELEESSLAWIMFKNDRGGFLAEVYTPLCENFSYADNKPSSWRINGSTMDIDWVYADTLDELSDKIVEVGEKNFKRFMEEANK